jgi:DNA-binding XRE family transcriptional regulator
MLGDDVGVVLLQSVMTPAVVQVVEAPLLLLQSVMTPAVVQVVELPLLLSQLVMTPAVMQFVCSDCALATETPPTLRARSAPAPIVTSRRLYMETTGSASCWLHSLMAAKNESARRLRFSSECLWRCYRGNCKDQVLTLRSETHKSVLNVNRTRVFIRRAIRGVSNSVSAHFRHRLIIFLSLANKYCNNQRVMMMTERPWLGERVRRLREEQALTQVELADTSGVSISTLARLEQTSWPVRAGTIRKLAKALGVPVAALTREELEP